MRRSRALVSVVVAMVGCSSRASDVDLRRTSDDRSGADGAADGGPIGAPPPGPVTSGPPPVVEPPPVHEDAAPPEWEPADAAIADAGASEADGGTLDAAGSSSDGDVPDAAADALLDGQLPTLETALVRDPAGVGVEGYPVVVSDAEGNTVAVAYTDATGTAKFDVPVDGAVTYVQSYTLQRASGTEQRHRITMLLDVPDGYSMSLRTGGTVTVSPGDPLPDPMTVQVLVAAAPAGAVSYRVALLCGEVREMTTTSTTFLGYYGCGAMSTFDTYAIALDASGQAIAHARVLDRSFVAGASDTVTLDQWATDFIELPYTAAPIPAGSTSTLVRLTGYRPGHFDLTARAGLRDEISLADPPSTLSRTLRLPAGLFSEFRLVGNVEISPSDPRILPGFDRFFTTFPTSFSYEPGALAVFEKFEEFDTGDPGRPGITYTLSPTGRLGDSMTINWSWTPASGETVSFAISGEPRRSRDLPLAELPPELQYVYRGAGDALGLMSALHDDDLELDGYLAYQAGPRKGDDKNGDSVSAFRTF